jgi:ATP-dependent Zn protease
MKATAVRKVVAYHEAGHAVVARLLGQSIVSVAIGADDDSAAAVTSSAAHAARERDAAAQVSGYETDAMIALAGPIAQVMSRPSQRDRAS